MATPSFDDLQRDQLPDPMSEADQIKANIETLKESIRLDWVDLAQRVMTPEERQELRAQIKSCVAELSEVLTRLDALDA